MHKDFQTSSTYQMSIFTSLGPAAVTSPAP